MTELTPEPVAGPPRTGVTGVFLGRTHNVDLVLHMGWQVTRDGQALPVPLAGVHRAQ